MAGRSKTRDECINECITVKGAANLLFSPALYVPTGISAVWQRTSTAPVCENPMDHNSFSSEGSLFSGACQQVAEIAADNFNGPTALGGFVRPGGGSTGLGPAHSQHILGMHPYNCEVVGETGFTDGCAFHSVGREGGDERANVGPRGRVCVPLYDTNRGLGWVVGDESAEPSYTSG